MQIELIKFHNSIIELKKNIPYKLKMNQNSKIQTLVDTATSNDLNRPDQNLNLSVC